MFIMKGMIFIFHSSVSTKITTLTSSIILKIDRGLKGSVKIELKGL